MTRVRKATPEEDLRQKEEAFLKLSGDERLRLMNRPNDRSDKPGRVIFKGLRVKVTRVK